MSRAIVSEEEVDNWDNLFSLLFRGRDDCVRRDRFDRAKEVTAQIESILSSAAASIRKLERYRLGIGDTATDEAIVDRMYQYLG